MSVRDLAAQICDLLQSCAPLMDILDDTDGIRRMDRPEPGSFTNCLCYGRITRRSQPGYPKRPIYNLTVTFTAYVRGEAQEGSMGDMILADIEERLMQIFHVGRHGITCTLPFPADLLILESRFDDFQSEPRFDHVLQAWMQSSRFRFLVAEPSCEAVQPWCVTCE